MARLAVARGARSLLIATHSAHEAAIADRMIVIESGKICGDFNRMDARYDEVASRLRGD